MSDLTKGPYFSLLPESRTDLANSEPHILWAQVALSSDRKQTRYEPDHSATPSTVVNNAWNSHLHSPFYMWRLIVPYNFTCTGTGQLHAEIQTQKPITYGGSNELALTNSCYFLSP
jgi:hypothetical protein